MILKIVLGIVGVLGGSYVVYNYVLADTYKGVRITYRNLGMNNYTYEAFMLSPGNKSGWKDNINSAVQDYPDGLAMASKALAKQAAEAKIDLLLGQGWKP